MYIMKILYYLCDQFIKDSKRLIRMSYAWISAYNVCNQAVRPS